MQISTILDRVDSGQISLPKFQRSYVWSREQVRRLFDSLYHKHPVGGLLIWETSASAADFRGSNAPPPGVVQLLLDGQQRVTTLYGVTRGQSPSFFDGDEKAFTGLMFHVSTERFEFYQATRMRGDPLWVNVTEVMRAGNDYLDNLDLPSNDHLRTSEIYGRLSRILGIRDIELPMQIMASQDMDLDTVVDIFNRVNSGGTKLSKGDLALAKICAGWPEARERMQDALDEWNRKGYYFDLVWLLRSINAVLTGRADFRYLDEKSPSDVQDGLQRAIRSIDSVIALIDGHLGLDHDRVFFARNAVPVMARSMTDTTEHQMLTNRASFSITMPKRVCGGDTQGTPRHPLSRTYRHSAATPAHPLTHSWNASGFGIVPPSNRSTLRKGWGSEQGSIPSCTCSRACPTPETWEPVCRSSKATLVE